MRGIRKYVHIRGFESSTRCPTRGNALLLLILRLHLHLHLLVRWGHEALLRLARCGLSLLRRRGARCERTVG